MMEWVSGEKRRDKSEGVEMAISWDGKTSFSLSLSLFLERTLVDWRMDDCATGEFS